MLSIRISRFVLLSFSSIYKLLYYFLNDIKTNNTIYIIMANTITKYDNLIKVLKSQVINEVNNTLSNQFNPILEEINRDISTFNLLEQLDYLVKEMPCFKNLQSKYNDLLIDYNKLKNNTSSSNDNKNYTDISLIINDIVKKPCNENNNDTISNNLNVKVYKKDNKYESSSVEDEIISDEETSSESSNYESDINKQPAEKIEETKEETKEESEEESEDESEEESEENEEEEEREEDKEEEEREEDKEEEEREEEVGEEKEEEVEEEREEDEEEEEREEDKEEEGEEEREEEKEEEEEEEVELIEIQGKEYFTNNEVGGEIYSCVDDDIGEKVGYFDDNGIAHFNKKK
ncbi:hypothetical protein ceV_063 [Chrysochromulina ericina virus CeV-01B]|uniref:Uncharacterized protein n=1 Tax=Chrysochromulina ericina virus CeV-01B TaxID=3070830 RepID=A0A0N7G7J6_9VIRU|nr:hypothetical protein ceV_063 [Chrysochromulina ericina virus]ALH22969.1 hypothetical protein ceV_063 [Chrysochromulina ericina virus CeV-01B]